MPPPGAPQQPQPPNSRKCVISVDYEPIYTKFSGLVPLTDGAEPLNFFYDTPSGGSPPPFCKTHSIWANIKPISTKFSGINTLKIWPGIGEKKMLKNVTPLGASHPPHILKHCLLLDISGNYEQISMKFSGISLLGTLIKMGEKSTEICRPHQRSPSSPNPPILENALSQSITNRFILIFQELFHLQSEPSCFNFFFWCPLSGQPTPPFVKHALSGLITNRFLWNFQKLIP